MVNINRLVADTHKKYEELDEDLPLEMQEKIDEMQAIKDAIEVNIRVFV